MIHSFICSSCRIESYITSVEIEPDYCPYCGNDEDNEVAVVEEYGDYEDSED